MQASEACFRQSAHKDRQVHINDREPSLSTESNSEEPAAWGKWVDQTLEASIFLVF